MVSGPIGTTGNDTGADGNGPDATAAITCPNGQTLAAHVDYPTGIVLIGITTADLNATSSS